MPSDARTAPALAALAPRIGRFRTAAGAAIEQARALVTSSAQGEGDRVGRVAGELGSFAAGRLDVARFAALFGPRGKLPGDARRAVELAIEALEALLARGDAPYLVTVPSGGCLRDAVAGALDECGRAFGAALVIEYARQGVHAPEHLELLRSFPFRRWNRAERRMAPPIVIEVDGSDLAGGALAEFVDGGVALALVARGACTPAPLVRLVTPGTFVMQADEPATLGRIAAVDGPAVAALVGEGSAHFTHEPGAGPTPRQRLAVAKLPPAPVRSIGGLSVWQQQEELAQLMALTAGPAEPPAPVEPGAAAASPALSTDPTNRLAAWLLSQAGDGGA